MNQLAYFAQQLVNTPIAMRADRIEPVMSALSARIRLGVQPLAGTDDDFSIPSRGDRTDKGYTLLAGVALIKIHGVLLQRLGWMGAYSEFLGCAGYDAIRLAVLNAASDSAVKAIVLDIDSPGGICAGMLDLADQIVALRDVKPIWAILNEEAYSAAYLLASACSRIVVPRTGGTGSIGIIAVVVEYSEMLSKAGVKPTLIHFGDRKVDGHPEIRLSDAARDRFQADVDSLGEMFADAVAANRGLAASKIKGFQATTFFGANGVTAGLADAVMAPDAAFRSLLAELA